MSKIRYPKFLLLILTFIIAYILFSGRNLLFLQQALLALNYLGSFFAGIFFVYGFTAAPATAILLIIAKQQNIVVSCLVAGIGSVIGDLIIFKIIRHSFQDEIDELSREEISLQIEKSIPGFLKKYLAVIFAGLIIASPLPDEIGVSLLAMATKISQKKFIVLSYVLNTIGIFVILLIGSGI
ncbi:MAG: hypothetical protein PHD95_04820 [Candidatus ainarchaeum sp.]|nr:hypothetical protein [Candidatus ainarchaeum sp.]